MGELRPVPPGDLADVIADRTRDALDRIAADIPIEGLHVGATMMRAAGGPPRPCPQIVLLLGPPYAPPGHSMTFWWEFTTWRPTQDQVDSVVREKMLELRASATTEAIAPPGLRPPGATRPPSTLFLPPGSPAGQG